VVGRHVSSSSDQDTYVVSEPLTRAAALEKVVRNPCVAIHEAIEIPDQWWPVNFPNVYRPILWFEGQQIVNPFHRYWYKSGKIIAEELSSLYPDHRSKYDWFIRLHDAVGREDPLIPPNVFVMQNG
jgi:hypothetical protein